MGERAGAGEAQASVHGARLSTGERARGTTEYGRAGEARRGGRG